MGTKTKVREGVGREKGKKGKLQLILFVLKLQCALNKFYIISLCIDNGLCLGLSESMKYL